MKSSHRRANILHILTSCAFGCCWKLLFSKCRGLAISPDFSSVSCSQICPRFSLELLSRCGVSNARSGRSLEKFFTKINSTILPWNASFLPPPNSRHAPSNPCTGHVWPAQLTLSRTCSGVGRRVALYGIFTTLFGWCKGLTMAKRALRIAL